MSHTVDLLDRAKAAAGGVSDYRIAQLCGIAQSLLSKYRNGKLTPGIEVVARLAEIAGTDPDAEWLAVCVDRASTDYERETWLRIGSELVAQRQAAMSAGAH